MVTSAHINGRDVITFDGTDDVLVGRMPAAMSSASLFIVASPSDTDFIYISRGASNYSTVAQSGSSSTGISGNFGSPTYYNTGNAVTWSTRNDVYSSIGSSTHIYEAIGCNLSSFANISPTVTYDLCGYGSVYFFSGDICEVIIYNSSLSSTDREKVEGYLAHKWGLTSSLPASHPYKSSAP